MIGFDLTHIAILVVVVEVIICYVYWRQILRIRPNYSYRAYDYLFATILVILVVGRVAGVLAAPEAFTRAGLGDYLRIWDLHFDYLVIVLVPMLVYQFFVTNVETYPEWKQHGLKFLLFGELFTLPLVAGQLGRAIITGGSEQLLIMHTAFLVWLVVMLVMISLRLRGTLSKWFNYPVLAGLLVGGWAVISLWFEELLEPRAVLITLIFQVVLLTLTAAPFLKLEPKRPVRQFPLR